MKLYVIRHGETDYNVLGKVQGQIDVELNDTGIMQAALARKEFNDYNFDLIFSSPLKRARQTTQILNQDRNIKVIYTDLLLEQNMGDYEGKSVEVRNNDFKDRDFDYKLHKVETKEELCIRVYKLLDEIKEKYSDKKILLVTHGGTICAIESYFSTDRNFPKEITKNCEFKEFIFK